MTGWPAPGRGPSRRRSSPCSRARPWRSGYGQFSAWRAALALFVALALQVGVNYANDYSDGVRGTDEHRTGPVRLVAGGLAPPRQVLGRGGRLPGRGLRGRPGPGRGDLLVAARAWRRGRRGGLVLHRRQPALRVPRLRRAVGIRLLRCAGRDRHRLRADALVLLARARGGRPGRPARLRAARGQQPARHRDRHDGGQAHARGHARRPPIPAAVRRVRRCCRSAPRSRSRRRGRSPCSRWPRCRWRWRRSGWSPQARPGACWSPLSGRPGGYSSPSVRCWPSGSPFGRSDGGGGRRGAQGRMPTAGCWEGQGPPAGASQAAGRSAARIPSCHPPRLLIVAERGIWPLPPQRLLIAAARRPPRPGCRRLIVSLRAVRLNRRPGRIPGSCGTRDAGDGGGNALA